MTPRRPCLSLLLATAGAALALALAVVPGTATTGTSDGARFSHGAGPADDAHATFAPRTRRDQTSSDGTAQPPLLLVAVLVPLLFAVLADWRATVSAAPVPVRPSPPSWSPLGRSPPAPSVRIA